MLTRIGMCGVVVVFLLSSPDVKGDEPTEDQTQTRDACNDARDSAISAKDSCGAAATSATAAAAAYRNASMTHLTDGEKAHCDSEDAAATSCFNAAMATEGVAFGYFIRANGKRGSGEIAWAAQDYAGACTYYEDAIVDYETWAECEFQLAEDDYNGAGETWSGAKDTVDEAASDPDCLFCHNPDAECDCLE